MATVRVDLAINSTGEQTLKQVATGFEGVGQAAKRSEGDLNSWTNAQQRAAQKMERMQETALKMNASLTQTNDKARMMADTLGQVSSTATASAAALGLPVGPLTTMNSLLPLTAIGWKTMTTAMVGFNSASVLAAGAGLAIGAMIGTWLRTFPAVSGFADKLANSLFGVANAAKVSASEQQKLNDAANKQIEERLNKQVALMRSQGMSFEAIRKTFDEEKKGRAAVLEMLDKQSAAEKKAAADAVKASEERTAANTKAAKDYTDAWMKAEQQKLETEQKMAKAAEDIRAIQIKNEEDELQNSVKLAIAIGKQKIAATEEEKKAREELAQLEKQWDEEEAQRRAKAIQDMRQFAAILASLAQMFGGFAGTVMTLGAGVIDTLANMRDEALQNASVWEKLGMAMSGAMAAFKSGSMAGGAAAGASAGAAFGLPGAIVGGLVGGVLGLFGKGKKERAEANALKDQFIEAAGGLDALMAKAKEAGVSLDALFNAKKPKEMEAAIAGIKGQLDTWDEANQKLNDAIERYGFTIDELGPRMSQQRLDEQFGQLYQDFQLLNQAGVDQGAIFEKMGPSVNAYIAAVKQAGGTIPEAMRPILQQFLDAGQLTDEFGNKLTDLSGLTFAETMTEQVQKIVDAVQQLVAALQQAIGGFQTLGNVQVINPSGGQFIDPTPKPPGFAQGGFIPEGGQFGTAVRVAEQGTGGEFLIPANKMGKVGGVTIGQGAVQINLGDVSVSGGVGLADLQMAIENGTAQGVVTALKQAGVAA